jgi:citrate synthase
MLIAVAAEADGNAGDFDGAATRFLQRARADRAKLAGFGHPLHTLGDPRAKRLVEVAREIGVAGRHVAAMGALERNIEAYGRSLPANVSLAIPALLLDAGFPAESLKGIPLLARCASLIAHLREESQTRLGFRLADAAVERLQYLPETR